MSQAPSPDPTAENSTPVAAVISARGDRARRKEPHRNAGLRRDSEDEWLLSYADMVTLLLTMFIALLLNARFDVPFAPDEPVGLRQFIEQLLQIRVSSPYLEGETFTIVGPQASLPSLPEAPGTALAVVKNEDFERIREREAALAEIQSHLRATQLDTFISAALEGDGIRLSIPNSILFASGAAELQGRGPTVIKALASILTLGSTTISVEGHTDSNPINTARFPSNWELSAQRAAAVVRVLAESGIDGRRLEAVGLGDSHPLADNGSEDGRRENRRVELLLRPNR